MPCLAINAALGRGKGLQARYGNGFAAINAFAIFTICNPLQSGAHILQLLLVTQLFGVTHLAVTRIARLVGIRLTRQVIRCCMCNRFLLSECYLLLQLG